MLLTAVRDEFIFHCQCRKLSEKTIRNYAKQINYQLLFLEREKETTHIEDVEPKQIKAFLLSMSRAGRKENYINDLLKAYKVFFRYAYEEDYTETLLTKKIQNMKKPKVVIRTFTQIRCFCCC